MTLGRQDTRAPSSGDSGFLREGRDSMVRVPSVHSKYLQLRTHPPGKGLLPNRLWGSPWLRLSFSAFWLHRLGLLIADPFFPATERRGEAGDRLLSVLPQPASAA